MICFLWGKILAFAVRQKRQISPLCGQKGFFIMKKLLSVAAAVCVLSASVSGYAACNIKISGRSSSPLCGALSYNSNGSTMVPFRSICEALGANVSWDAATNTASAECSGKTVSFRIGDRQILTDNGTVELPTVSCNRNGSAYVPLRALCEALGCNVKWDQASSDITVEPQENENCENDGSCPDTPSQNSQPSLPQNIFNHFFGNGSSSNSGSQQAQSYPSAPVPAETPSSNTESSYELQVLDLVNEQRSNYGLAPLSYSTELEAVAYMHSKDMAQNNYFDHTNLSGQSPFDRIKAAGISYRSAAENIAAGQRTPQEVVNSWMNSSGHRANILNSSVTKMGVGIYSGGSYGIYWTQLFIG